MGIENPPSSPLDDRAKLLRNIFIKLPQSGGGTCFVQLSAVGIRLSLLGRCLSLGDSSGSGEPPAWLEPWPVTLAASLRVDSPTDIDRRALDLFTCYFDFLPLILSGMPYAVNGFRGIDGSHIATPLSQVRP